MCTPLELLAGSLLLAVFGACVIGLVLYSRFLSYLTQQHRGEWNALGQPGVVTVEGEPSDMAASSFIVRRTYRRLGDPRLTQIGDRVWMAWLVSIAVLVAAMTAVFVSHTSLNFLGLECLNPWRS
jgi:predicted Co/Zn/Cd cation transporter (cation efflux family)